MFTSNPRHHRYTFAAERLGVGYLSEFELTFEGHKSNHSHHQHQFLAALEGGMLMRIGERVEPLPPGHVLAIPADVRHLPEPLPPFQRALLLDLRPTRDQGPLEQEVERLIGPARPVDPTLLRDLVERLRHTILGSDARQGPKVLAELWRLLAAVPTRDEEARQAQAEATNTDRRVQFCEHLLRANFSREIDLDEVAKHVNLSRSQLNRLYRQELQIGPAERLRQIRLRAAQDLLRGSTLSIKEISFRCGFGSVNTLIRLFQAEHGTSPNGFRQQAG